jgi:hypothetical protein
MPSRVRDIVTFSLLFILLLTAIAAVFANLGVFGLDPKSNFAKTTLGAILIEIVSAVVLVWKTGALRSLSISATIRFPQDIQPEDLHFDVTACCYEIRNMKAEVKSFGKISVVFGNGGWECRMPAPEDFDDSITLTLKEKCGRVWEVRPFYALSRDVKAIVLNTSATRMELQ